MKYCSSCGAPIVSRVPPGDHVPRFVCDRCEIVHYQNPNIVAGCIPEWQGRVLLCRRAIEPRSGLWTLPAGFMENGETTAEAAARETLEEANAEMEQLVLYGVYNLPRINQVYMMFRGRVREGRASTGAESLEVGFFTEAEIPWEEIAFPVVRETLETYFSGQAAPGAAVHMADIARHPQRGIVIKRHGA